MCVVNLQVVQPSQKKTKKKNCTPRAHDYSFTLQCRVGKWFFLKLGEETK